MINYTSDPSAQEVREVAWLSAEAYAALYRAGLLPAWLLALRRADLAGGAAG